MTTLAYAGGWWSWWRSGSVLDTGTGRKIGTRRTPLDIRALDGENPTTTDPVSHRATILHQHPADRTGEPLPMSHRTRDDDGKQLPERRPRKRKKRPNLIGSSRNRDAYHRLMQAGWSSTSLSFYAAQWFGDTISASTFRSYRARKGWPARAMAANVRDGENEALPAGWDPRAEFDGPLDVLHLRAELIRLQQLRVALAVRNEVRTGALEPTTRLEITALDKLLEAAKGDQQLLGMLPGASRGEDDQDTGAVRDAPDDDGGGLPGAVGVPEWAADRAFGDVLPGLSPRAEAAMARAFQEAGLLGNGQVGESNGHGQVVDGG